jgi:hypothetical protein
MVKVKLYRCGQEADSSWARQVTHQIVPDRSERIELIRRKIARGEYPTPSMFAVATDRLMAEIRREGASGGSDRSNRTTGKGLAFRRSSTDPM